jgi:methylated-DNA-[protein]-cysteine S-methyltransferase
MPFIIQWANSCTGPEELIKINTPAGKLVIHSFSGVISETDWILDDSPLSSSQHAMQHQFDAYWKNPDTLVPVNLLKQGTPFRNRVWTELCNIGVGETLSYSGLAKKIGSAPRAVGNACRDNPFPLLIPCHRVVSVSGMGGYNGHTGGEFMTVKRKLLDFESAYQK